MSIQIAEILQRLQSALDQNYNVADMDTVLQVITELENIQITKEQLETTRLGKHINHLRRKTANESLARRAKNLLKKWREMVLPASSGGATQQQLPHSQKPNIPRVSPALAQQHDDRGVQPQFYNQNRMSTQFHDTSEHIIVDNSKYPTGDSRRHGRIHETGSNHALLPAKNPSIAADQNEDCTRYTNKFHDIKSNLNTNVGGQLTSSNFSGKNKEPDPYRMLSTNDNLKSHISISALPKIPKIKNSATSLRLSKHTDRSHSPLVNLKESSSMPKFSSSSHDENSVHVYDVQNYKHFQSNQSSISNGRNPDYGDNSTAMDNNSNSSSVNIIEPDTIVPNISQLSSESLTNEVLKKKHKKHKKDKKGKKQKQLSSPATTEQTSVTSRPPVLELPDSLSSNSISLFANTSDSMKDQHMPTNSNAFLTNVGTSLPSTSINHAAKSVLWTPTITSNTVSSDDLTFSGRFKRTDDNIINIDSSSGASNSPKYHSKSPMLLTAKSRSSSPSRIFTLPMRGTDCGSRIATDEENSSKQHISLLNQNESSQAGPYGDSLVQDDILENDIPRTSVSNIGQLTGKKRGRKKGSKGVDSRLGSASNSSHSQQAGAPYYDSISFSSLKNKIELIRGTTKKVKTTKELLAELQNRKATTSTDDGSAVESQLQSHQDVDENGLTNGKYNLGLKITTPMSPMLSSHTRITSSERSSSKKSKSAAVGGSMSDNQSSYENQAAIEIGNAKSIVDQEIEELHAKLPPVNRAALRAWQKSTYNNSIVCTCKLIEITDKDNSIEMNDNPTTKDHSVENINVPKMLTDCNVLPQAALVENRPYELNDNRCEFSKSIPPTEYNSTVATSNSINTPNVKSIDQDPPFKKPTVKSIFDLDYDDDDPITFKLNHNNNINLNTNLNKISSNSDSNNDISDDKSCDELFLNENINQDGEVIPIKCAAKSNFPTDSEQHEQGKVDDCNPIVDGMQSNVHNSDSNITAANTNVIPSKTMQEEPKALNADLNAIEPQPRFRVEEDVNCNAKQLYITSKQSITEYHIKNLHTSYIPNINGNWDDAKGEEDSMQPQTKIGCDDVNLMQTICGDEEQTAQKNIESTMETTIHDQDGQASKETTLEREDDKEEFEMEPRITEISIGLYERVVPLCNYLTIDQLPKNLSHTSLNFGPSDEVEPHIFLANIMVKKEITTEMESQDSTTNVENIVHTNENNPHIVADDSFEAKINQNFRIYDCSNDINDIESGRKHSTDIGLMDLDQGCEDLPPDFECEPIEHICEMDVDDIVMNNANELKSETDNNVYSIANDPFVEMIEPKNNKSIEESDIELHNENEPVKSPSPVIDENARASIDDTDNLHQVIDLSPNQILPESDENAMDSMDFESQYSKSYDMAIERNLEEYQNNRDKSEERQSIENIEAELDIHITDLSEQSDDEENYDDDESLEEDLCFENYEQKNSNDHFITLENFDKELKDSQQSSSDSMHSHSSNSSSRSSSNSSSCDHEANKKATNMICDGEEYEEHENMTDNETGEDTPDRVNANDVMLPTMFCKPVFFEGDKTSNLLNESSYSQLDTNSDKSDSNDSKCMEFVHPELDHVDKRDPTKLEFPLTEETLKTHEAIHGKVNHKRHRSYSSSTTYSSTNSSWDDTSSSNSNNKKSKPCPEKKLLLPSFLPIPIATKLPKSTSGMDLNDTKENSVEHTNIGFNDDQLQVSVVKVIQEQQQLSTKAYLDEQIRTNKTDVEQFPTSTPGLMHDGNNHNNASFAENHNDNLFFHHSLPEQLFQCDEKEGDGQSNSTNIADKNSESQDGSLQDRKKEETETESSLLLENNGMLPSFNDLTDENITGVSSNGYRFKEWYETLNVRSYNDEIITILPYCVID
ncbi:putative uncharacterized protein DDB_G0282133 isoform X2 [Contarinia nasturtii]|uniref:putative uncharacterized protein DDB_G0282133 isoform X2 n=1 Tax=Contarinia nasturtii TaxID=265458 RepID=UPI0012D39542|nr:putative uncharacterized protein DDB_G0282133 isoform X2 [Contarinia nasturtii]